MSTNKSIQHNKRKSMLKYNLVALAVKSALQPNSPFWQSNKE